MSPAKVETPYQNSCLFDSPKQKTPVNKFLSNQNKQFSSVPENINNLSTSPSQNFLNSPYGSLGTNSLSGSLSNLPLPHSGSQGNLNHSSSTGNIPQAVNQYEQYQNIHTASPYHRSPCGTPSNYIKMEYNPNSPMSVGDDSMGMDIDNITNGHNGTLSWLDLNIDTGSPPGFNCQNIPSKESLLNSNTTLEMNTNMLHQNTLFCNNNTRAQMPIFGSSPRNQDGFVSLFDLEGGEY